MIDPAGEASADADAHLFEVFAAGRVHGDLVRAGRGLGRVFPVTVDGMATNEVYIWDIGGRYRVTVTRDPEPTPLAPPADDGTA